MDLTQILPLIGGDKAQAILPLLSGMNGGGKSGGASMPPNDGGKSALIESLTKGNPNATKLLGVMNALQTGRRHNPKQMLGIGAITPFAGSDIIGMLFKLLHKK